MSFGVEQDRRSARLPAERREPEPRGCRRDCAGGELLLRLASGGVGRRTRLLLFIQWGGPPCPPCFSLFSGAGRRARLASLYSVGRAAVPALLLFIQWGGPPCPPFGPQARTSVVPRRPKQHPHPHPLPKGEGAEKLRRRPEPLSHTSPQWKLLPSLPSSARPGKEMTWARLFQWGGPPCPPHYSKIHKLSG